MKRLFFNLNRCTTEVTVSVVTQLENFRGWRPVGSCLLFFSFFFALPEAVADINITVLAVPVAPGPCSKRASVFIYSWHEVLLCALDCSARLIWKSELWVWAAPVYWHPERRVEIKNDQQGFLHVWHHGFGGAADIDLTVRQCHIPSNTQ